VVHVLGLEHPVFYMKRVAVIPRSEK